MLRRPSTPITSYWIWADLLPLLLVTLWADLLPLLLVTLWADLLPLLLVTGYHHHPAIPFPILNIHSIAAQWSLFKEDFTAYTRIVFTYQYIACHQTHIPVHLQECTPHLAKSGHALSSGFFRSLTQPEQLPPISHFGNVSQNTQQLYLLVYRTPKHQFYLLKYSGYRSDSLQVVVAIPYTFEVRSRRWRLQQWHACYWEANARMMWMWCDKL